MSTTPTSSRNETRVEVDPEVPRIVIVREFDAPRERVFRAHTDPDLVARWMGPRQLRMRVEELDARTGGSYRYVHVDTDGTEYGFRGVFHEVSSPERIVQTWAFDDYADQVSLETMTLEDLGGRTRLHAVSVLGSFEARDGLVASGMEDGLREGYERLDELLAADATSSAEK